METVRVHCDIIDSGADVTFSTPQGPDITIIREHIARSFVLSTMVVSAEEDETSFTCEFTAPEGYLQAWSELMQDDKTIVLNAKSITSLLVLLKVLFENVRHHDANAWRCAGTPEAHNHSTNMFNSK
jgi:hypothetical protein